MWRIAPEICEEEARIVALLAVEPEEPRAPATLSRLKEGTRRSAMKLITGSFC